MFDILGCFLGNIENDFKKRLILVYLFVEIDFYFVVLVSLVIILNFSWF